MVVATIGEGLFELGLDEDADAPLRRGYGGDAANTAVMAVRLGAEARLCSRVGADALGRELLAFWRASGVDPRWVALDGEAPTGIYVNERLAAGGSLFHYHRRGSAGSRLSPADVGEDFFAGVGVVHSTGVTLAISDTAAEAVRSSAVRARERGIDISFAVNYRPALAPDVAALAEQARAADVLFVSAEEAGPVFGVDRVDEIRRAVGPGPRELVVTDGERGAFVVTGRNVRRAATTPVEVVDAAGAGDALAGAYLASRSEGLSPGASLVRGVAAATLSCGAFGCALSYPDAAAVAAATRQIDPENVSQAGGRPIS